MDRTVHFLMHFASQASEKGLITTSLNADSKKKRDAHMKWCSCVKGYVPFVFELWSAF